MTIVYYILLLCYVLYIDKPWFHETVLRKKKYCSYVKIKPSSLAGKGTFSFQFGTEMCQQI